MSSGLAILTLTHVAISLVAIGLGFVVVMGLMSGKWVERSNAWFLGTTLATSITGFFFPIHGLTPGIVIGMLSILVLALAIVARYMRHLNGPWRRVYVVCAVTALYFNVFVLIVQSFLKIPALRALAPTQSEPPFAAAQLVVLAAFLIMGFLASARFREKPGTLA
jgi:hypothetical protein